MKKTTVDKCLLALTEKRRQRNVHRAEARPFIQRADKAEQELILTQEQRAWARRQLKQLKTFLSGNQWRVCRKVLPKNHSDGRLVLISNNPSGVDYYFCRDGLRRVVRYRGLLAVTQKAEPEAVVTMLASSSEKPKSLTKAIEQFILSHARKRIVVMYL